MARSLRAAANASSSLGGDESTLSDVHAPAASEVPTPSPSTSMPDRNELGLAIIAALVVVLVAATLLLVRRRRRKPVQRAAAQSCRRIDSRINAFGFEDLSSVDWFRATDASTGGANPSAREQSRGGDSFCGSWEHPDVEASRVPVGEVRLMRRVHRGAHSDVYRARFRGAFVAAKKPSAQWLANVRHLDALFCEVRLLASLRHEHIVAFVGVAWRSLLDVHVLTEFMDGGDLRALLWRFEHDERAANRRPKGFDRDKLRIAAHVASALAYLHAQAPRKLTHMALRSSNVLLSASWAAKLTDFRAASVEKYMYDLPATAAHSLWSAPEVLRGEQADDKADVFSFGVLLAEIDSHRAPYGDTSAASTVDSDCEFEPATGSERGSADRSALLARIASGRATVKFSPAAPASPLTAGELVTLRQAQDAASNGAAGSAMTASGARSVLSLESAASFVASPFVHAEVARIGRECVALDPHSRPTARELERELRTLAHALDALDGRR